jgi:hypothetical protein
MSSPTNWFDDAKAKADKLGAAAFRRGDQRKALKDAKLREIIADGGNDEASELCDAWRDGWDRENVARAISAGAPTSGTEEEVGRPNEFTEFAGGHVHTATQALLVYQVYRDIMGRFEEADTAPDGAPYSIEDARLLIEDAASFFAGMYEAAEKREAAERARIYQESKR